MVSQRLANHSDFRICIVLFNLFLMLIVSFGIFTKWTNKKKKYRSQVLHLAKEKIAPCYFGIVLNGGIARAIRQKYFRELTSV